jgi:hypothetical protein
VGRFDPGEPVAVAIGGCACPSTPHADGDVVYLRPRLDYAGGSEAISTMQAASGSVEDLARSLVPVYIRHGAIGWNLVDDDGAPVPFDVEALLSDWTVAYEVGEAADTLYSEAVLSPLLQRASSSSPPTPINGSTSRKRGGRASRPKPSLPSSTGTSAMGSIVTTGNWPASASSS